MLLWWALERGADEFSVTGILTEGGSRDAFDAFDRLADQHKLPPQPRYQLGGKVEMTELWRFNPDTINALRVAFPRGYFQYFPEDAWFEDLMVYRQGELILGVITHESEGVVRVTLEDRRELDGRWLVYDTKGQYVGY